ncbi:MAG TPA: TonB-dependent receptor plug domain-containing protein [Saprospiraceae bacterium]|nr:TonB-dependent receptor plug domain-containing protein [Saprospiraceae bacterium]
MRGNFVVILFLSFLFVLELKGQKDNLDKLYSFSFHHTTLDKAFGQISKTSAINISFDQAYCEKRQVTKYFVNHPLRDILGELSAEHNLKLVVINSEQIAIEPDIPQESNEYYISGRVEDSASQELIIGAIVSNGGNWTMTNDYGYFVLKSKHKFDQIEVFQLGYAAKLISLQGNPFNFLTIRLSNQSILPTVIVSQSSDRNSEMKEWNEGIVSTRFIAAVPTAFGDRDVQRSLQSVAGVSGGADGFGGLNVRGGGYDQNLIMLDDVPLYYSNHALGLFSIFNPDAIRNIQFVKDNFAAKYGGKLSSVIDIHSKDGSFNTWNAMLSTGLLSSKIQFDGPLMTEKLSCFFSARRTMIDPFIKSLTKYFKEQGGKEGETKYYFYDLNAKLSYLINSKSRVYLSYYTGKDFFNDQELLYTENDNNSAVSRNFDQLEWRNQIASLRYHYSFTKSVFLNQVFYYGTYHSSSEQFEGYLTRFNGVARDSFLLGRSFYTRLNYFGWNSFLDLHFGGEHQLKTGWTLMREGFKPALYTTQLGSDLKSEFLSYTPGPIDSILQKNKSSLPEFHVFIQHNKRWNRSFNSVAGIRATYLEYDGVRTVRLQPRASLITDISKQLTLSICYDRNIQTAHLISSNSLGLPTDLWVPVTKEFGPQTSDQFTFNLDWTPASHSYFKLSAYFKNSKQLVQIKEGASFLFAEIKNWKEQLTTGSGKSKGLELSYRFQSSKLMCQPNITWSKSTRKFELLNRGQEFLYKYDRPIQIKLLTTYQLFEHTKLHLYSEFATGSPVSLPSGDYLYYSTESGYPQLNIYHYDKLNNERLPDYFRLDLGLSYTLTSERIGQEFYIGVYNLTNRLNPIFIELDGSGTGSINSKFQQVSLMPLLPSVSYRISWRSKA